VTPGWLFTVTVPIIEADSVNRVLVIGLDAPLTLGEVLQVTEVPDYWTLAILDREQRIMARTPPRPDAIGRVTPASIRHMLEKAQSGTGRSYTLDNRAVQTFFNSARKSGWMVLVGVPQEDFDGAVRRAVTPVFLTGFLVLIGSLLAAWMMGRRFTHQLASIARAAGSYRRGESPQPLATSRIVEIAELQETLSAAFAARVANEQKMVEHLAEKDLLMQESHHRVKNSLQLVRGILNLQGRQAQHPEARLALSQASARILTVADIHQHLYQGLSTVEANVRQYLTDLVRDLGSSTLPAESGRHVTLASDSVVWPSEKLTALGLIAAELITNAVKYGGGDIAVVFKVQPGGSAELVVTDEGQGFAPDIELGSGAGLGSKVITSLVRPPEGDVAIDRNAPGVRVVVTLNDSWRAELRRA
jgi:two-component sensor histidine kinase